MLQHRPGEPAEGFDKLDGIVPPEQLAAFAPTACGTDRAEMLAAARSLLALYVHLARPAAEQHGLDYRTDLEGVMTRRLAALAP